MSLPSLNFFNSKTNDKNSFEMIKNVTEKELYEFNSGTYKDFHYSVNIGYITSKYVPDIKDTGCYIIMINSQMTEGPNAIFCISRSDKSKSGNIQCLVESKGTSNDTLELVWNPYEYPSILLKHNFNRKQILKDSKELNLKYSIKIIKP